MSKEAAASEQGGTSADAPRENVHANDPLPGSIPVSQVEGVAPSKPHPTAVGSLPGGMIFKEEEGFRLVRDVVYKEATGQVRMLLGDPKLRNNIPQLLTTYLLKCIESIGGQKPSEKMIKSMLVGDRDYSALKIYALTFGGEEGTPPTTQFRCGTCSKTGTAEVNISEFGLYELDDNMDKNVVTVGIGPQERHARAFKVVLPEHGLKLAFRRGDGFDQELVASLGVGNPIAAQHAMIISTCVHWEQDGKVVKGALSSELLSNLGVDTIHAIENAYLENACGLETSHSIDCWNCGAVTEVNFNVSDFIAKAPKQRKRSKKKFS